jgi:two-component system sensor histidine kinase YesM
MCLWKRKINLKKRVAGMLIITIVPATLCMFLVSLISYQTIRQQIYSSSYDTLSLYCSQIDNELKSVADIVLNIDPTENYVDMFQNPIKTQNYYAAIYYKRTMSIVVPMLEHVEGIAAFSGASGAVVYHYNARLNHPYQDRFDLISSIKTHAAELAHKQWAPFVAGGKHYLVYSYAIRETYFYAWASINDIIKAANDWELAKNGTVFITGQNNEVMAQSNDRAGAIHLSGDVDGYYFSGNKYLILGVASSAGNFKLIEAINIRELTSTYEGTFFISVGILIVFLLLLSVFFNSLNYHIFYPIDSLQKAIAAIDSGQLNYQIQPFQQNTEFQHLIMAFNSMVRQIERQKIEAYECKIEQDRIMMQYLQLQIEPHFYLNALNTINAMAQVGDTDLIVKQTKNLSDYMSFITKSKGGTVTIREELDHIKNYMDILETRMGSGFICTVELDEALASFKIPPLAIQILVENVMKYVFDIYANTEIHIKVRRLRRDGQCGISLSVEDNGRGYPEDILRHFGKEGESGGIGLQNIRKRLFYLYGEKAAFQISNRPEGGAKAEIWIQTDGGGGKKH